MEILLWPTFVTSVFGKQQLRTKFFGLAIGCLTIRKTLNLGHIQTGQNKKKKTNERKRDRAASTVFSLWVDPRSHSRGLSRNYRKTLVLFTRLH